VAERHSEFVAVFSVSGVNGEFAPEVYFLRTDNPTLQPSGHSGHQHLGFVWEVFFGIEQLPAGARVHVDLLGPESDPSVESNWRRKYRKYNEEGVREIVRCGHRHVRVRCKSGAESGEAVVDVTWTMNLGLR
jgi:hypothetical protein